MSYNYVIYDNIVQIDICNSRYDTMFAFYIDFMFK